MSSSEEAAVEHLISTRWSLITDGERVDTKSEDGGRACAAYLEAVEMANEAMRLQRAPRKYRRQFTVNYRALFPDLSRNYRVDVLEASFEQYSAIWVNGDKFEFSPDVVSCAEALQRAWWSLGAVLENWSQAAGFCGNLHRPAPTELGNALLYVDIAWAQFEEKYILELIDIEEKARSLIVRAIEHERHAHLLKPRSASPRAQRATGPERGEEPGEEAGTEDETGEAGVNHDGLLVACIARLNSVANIRRKGRDDFDVGILTNAMETLRKCEAAEQRGASSEKLVAARILASGVVTSYNAIREYLHRVEHCLERVDPHLCNNSDLVAILVEWEESWELGSKYMDQEPVLNALGDLVAAMRRAQSVAPRIAVLREECNAELFLLLPRIIWLFALGRPHRFRDLLEGFLPHRFEGDEVDHDLARVAAQMRSLGDELYGPCSSSAAAGEGNELGVSTAFEDMLIRRLVDGTEDCPLPFCPGPTPPAEDPARRREVESLVLALEPLSIELQRHCAEEWNQCCAVLIRCMAAGGGTGE